GVALKANLVGTDLIPAFLQATANRGYRYFLLGAAPEAIEQAAQFAQTQFSGWELVGYHHGYLADPEQTETVMATLNATRPDLLLVGMGNPLQEEWIAGQQLQVPLSIGVGGLFDHWSGRLVRAPLWVRELGLEWLQILIQQPHKWRRYLIGNVQFLLRMLRGVGG
ncbi:MAG: WecB/TagA/CpsF family glycosyltransferase, partial [Elainella sp.]